MFPKVWVQSQTQKSKTKSKKKQNYCGNANKVLCPCGKYTTFLDAAMSCAISSAVSILLNSTRPSPASPIKEIMLNSIK